MKPVCYMRYLNGEPDWSEDCITVDNSAIDDHEDDADHVWESVPLYRVHPAQPAVEPVAYIVTFANGQKSLAWESRKAIAVASPCTHEPLYREPPSVSALRDRVRELEVLLAGGDAGNSSKTQL
jgi:hypothetical protein